MPDKAAVEWHSKYGVGTLHLVAGSDKAEIRLHADKRAMAFLVRHRTNSNESFREAILRTALEVAERRKLKAEYVPAAASSERFDKLVFHK